MSASWLAGWLTGDIVTATELGKSTGSFYDSTLGVATSSFDITSVPTWGANIHIDAYLRGDTSAATTSILVRFNNDSSASYIFTLLAVTTSTNASTATSTSAIQFGPAPAASAAANVWGPFTMDIPSFRSAHSKIAVGNSFYAGSPMFAAGGGYWSGTQAITRITVSPGAGNWAADSRLTAYVKGP